MGSASISNMAGGDVVIIELDNDLIPGGDYNITAYNDGNSYIGGFYDAPSFDYPSPDTNLVLTGSADGNKTGTYTASATVFDAIGNISL